MRLPKFIRKLDIFCNDYGAKVISTLVVDKIEVYSKHVSIYFNELSKSRNGSVGLVNSIVDKNTPGLG
jgi:hypothetical protein